MFRGSYQRKLLTVLYSGGSNPLEIWDIQVKNGWTRRVKDDDLGTIVFEIAGTNVATAYIVSPPEPKKVLGISLPFITMIIKNLKRYFTFEIQILDDKRMRRRFRFSNYQSSTKVRPFTCSVPLSLKPGWNQMQLNLANFTMRAYGTQYLETQRVQIHANCRIRRVYFSDRLYTEEELPRDYRIYLNVRQAPQQEKGIKTQPKDMATTSGKSLASVATGSMKELATKSAKELATESAKELATKSEKELATESMKELATKSAKELATESAKELAFAATMSAQLIAPVATESLGAPSRSSFAVAHTSYDTFTGPKGETIEVATSQKLEGVTISQTGSSTMKNVTSAHGEEESLLKPTVMFNLDNEEVVPVIGELPEIVDTDFFKADVQLGEVAEPLSDIESPRTETTEPTESEYAESEPIADSDVEEVVMNLESVNKETAPTSVSASKEAIEVGTENLPEPTENLPEESTENPRTSEVTEPV